MPTVFSTLIRTITNQNPNLVIILGDDVQLSDVGSIEAHESDERWENFVNVTKIIRATTPFFSTVGNHDEPNQPAALKKFQEIWPHPHNGFHQDETTYWFEYGNSLFVVLNSEESNSTGKISEAQINWLKNILKKPGYTHKFVFLHRPLLGSNRKVTNSEQLHQLFVANKVTAAFSGHNHLFCKYQKDGILYLTTGGAGAPLYKNLCLGYEISTYHYVLINVNGNKISGQVIDENGKIIYTFAAE
jgi:predicted phosphodiesterase